MNGPLRRFVAAADVAHCYCSLCVRHNVAEARNRRTQRGSRKSDTPPMISGRGPEHITRIEAADARIGDDQTLGQKHRPERRACFSVHAIARHHHRCGITKRHGRASPIPQKLRTDICTPGMTTEDLEMVHKRLAFPSIYLHCIVSTLGRTTLSIVDNIARTRPHLCKS